MSCVRFSIDKKFPSENWTNMFFSCNNRKKVWCGSCMRQVTGLDPNKSFKFGKKGQVTCPTFSHEIIMMKLPEYLRFTQRKGQGEDSMDSESFISGNNHHL